MYEYCTLGCRAATTVPLHVYHVWGLWRDSAARSRRYAESVCQIHTPSGREHCILHVLVQYRLTRPATEPIRMARLFTARPYDRAPTIPPNLHAIVTRHALVAILAQPTPASRTSMAGTQLVWRESPDGQQCQQCATASTRTAPGTPHPLRRRHLPPHRRLFATHPNQPPPSIQLIQYSTTKCISPLVHQHSFSSRCDNPPRHPLIAITVCPLIVAHHSPPAVPLR